jgi:hypothetical protein
VTAEKLTVWRGTPDDFIDFTRAHPEYSEADERYAGVNLAAGVDPSRDSDGEHLEWWEVRVG